MLAIYVLLAAFTAGSSPYIPPEPTPQSWRVVSFVDDARLRGCNVFTLDFDRRTNSPTFGTAWLATSDGLREYDGYRWTRHGKASGGLPSNFIRCVLVTRAGVVWVGSDQGAGVYDGKTYQTFGSETNLAGPGVRRIVEDPDGTVWFCSDPWPNATQSGGITSYRNGQWRAYRAKDGLPSEYVVNYFRDSAGHQWVVTKDGVAELQGGRWVTSLTPAPNTDGFTSGSMAETARFGLMFSTGYDVFLHRNGAWEKQPHADHHQFGVCSTHDGNVFACQSFNSGRKTIAQWTTSGWRNVSGSFDVPHGYSEDIKEDPAGNIWVVGFETVVSWRRNTQWQEFPGVQKPKFVDASGQVWFARTRVGMLAPLAPVRFTDGAWDKLDMAYEDLWMDSSGTVWGWTTNLLSQWRGKTEIRFGEAETGLRSIRSGRPDSQGRFSLLGQNSGGITTLTTFDDGKWTQRPMPELDGTLRQTSITETGDRAWFVLHYRDRTNIFAIHVTGTNTESIEIPRQITSEFRSGLHASTNSSDLWLYGDNGLYRWKRGGKSWEPITNTLGRAAYGVLERHQELWAACSGATGGRSGLARLRDGQWKNFEIETLFNFTIARDGTLLLGGKGRFHYVTNGPDAEPVEVALPENIPVHAVVKDHQGRFWAGNESSVFQFTPDGIAPETRILNESTNLLSGETLAIRAQAIERFRPIGHRKDHAFSWRMNGGEWSPFVQDDVRRLSDDDLTAGVHHIEVRARDAGGDVDATPAVFTLQVRPVPIQERAWFSWMVLGTVSLLAALSLIAVRARAQLATYAKTLERKVTKRTTALEADLIRGQRAEEALRESQERWQFALEGAGDGVWDWNPQTNRVHFSTQWKSMLGYTDHDIRNHVDEWDQRIHPEDKARVVAELQDHLEGRVAVYVSEHRLLCKDGSYKWILDRGKVMSRTPEGKPLRVIGTHTDITKRKTAERALRESEERLRFTLDNLLEGCQVVGFDWRYLYVNRVAAQQGRTTSQELQGRTMMEAYPGIEQTVLFNAMRSCMNDRVGMKFENQFKYPDGTNAIFDLDIQPIAEGIFIHSIDITARRQAEEAREKLANLVEHSGDFIATASLDGHLTYLNAAGRRMIGFGQEEDLGTLHFGDYVPEPWRTEFLEKVVAQVRTTGFWEGEMQLCHLVTRDLIDISRSMFLIRDPRTGEPLSFATVTRDITARKRSERALRESEERFSKAFQANPAIIAISTWREGRYVDLNDAYTTLLGYTRDEVLGCRALDLGIWTLPAQRTAIIDALDHGEAVRGVECTLRSKSGRLYTVLASAERIELGGEPCVLFINYDITARKEAETIVLETKERFSQLAENIREVFWLSNVEKNQILYISPGYEKIWGRTCESIYKSPATWMEAIHPDDRQRVVESAFQRQAAGDYDLEYRIVRPDGDTRWIHDRAFPVRNAAGEVYRVAGIAEDITERRQLEQQFRQAQKMEALGTLSGGIAHDFNNILGAIFGNVYLAKQDLDPAHPTMQSVEEIEKAANRAKNLVRQILAFSRRQPQTRQVISMAPIIGEAASLLRATLPAGVELIKTIDAEAPNVFADASQIHQVLLNLCTNAWHALNGGGGRIEIQLRNVEIAQEQGVIVEGLHRGRYACLAVVDNGHGMDAATLERIFEPFFTTKDPGQGTGLGLAVVHGIVQSHDGILRVVSQPGQGTTFQLYFPAVDAEVETRDPGPRKLRLGSGQRILYVDDESALVDLAARMLRRLGYAPEGYTDPGAAFDAFRTDPGRYDLIITDLHMPGSSGLEFTERVRQVRPDIHVVMSSGQLTEDIVQKARKLGVKHLLHKPNSLEDLSESIHRLLNSKQA